MKSMENNFNTFEEDVFNRRRIAENLTKIIESQNESMVISLDSEWGTGKTTFVKMWKNMLGSSDYNERFKTIYFNAWENDYIKDPFLSLFSELEDEISKENSELKQNFEKVKKVIIPMAKLAAMIGIKVGTAGMLDLGKINLGDNSEDAIVDVAGKFGDLIIKEIKASKNVRSEFKKVMYQFQKETNKKIIFFIDELDRCRPTFAIELLEVIKHLFDIDNCIFIISIDKEQLSYSVTTIYGNNMDTLGYLRRFFDLDYKLPKINAEEYIKNKIVYSDKYNIDIFNILIKEMFVTEKFSLRDIDKAYYYLKLLIPLIPEFNTDKTQNNDVYIPTISYLYATLITLKIKKPILYKEIIDCNYIVEDIINKCNIPNLEHCKENHIGGWHQKSLQKVINAILKPFLILNLRFSKEGYIRSYEEDEFAVGLKNDDGTFYYRNKYNLEDLFNNKGLNIINKLEFIDSFKMS
ncbi:MAG: hypothetical protein K0S61_2255 [Anaerocolumna sp.]|jgi:hypothetical protein|nr:hypothetical protein [Anaerocolumna sp.]